jgi:hypothetical protein
MTRMIRALVVAALGLATGVAVLLLPATPASACSCAALTAAQSYDGADVVFSGRLVSREQPVPGSDGSWSSADPATLTFQVSRVYKGTVAARQQLTTAASGDSCGLEISGAGPFLVFANTAATGGLTSTLCGGTTDDVSSATWPWTAPVPASRPAGEAGPIVAADRVTPGGRGTATGAVVAAGSLLTVGAVVVAVTLTRRRRHAAG